MTNEELQNAARESKEKAQRAIFDQYFSYVAWNRSESLYL